MVDLLMALRDGSVPHRRTCAAGDARRDRQKVQWCLASGMANFFLLYARLEGAVQMSGTHMLHFRTTYLPSAL